MFLSAILALVTPIAVFGQDAPLNSPANSSVSPSRQVVRSVVIRTQPTTLSAALGGFKPDQHLPVVEIQPNWVGVRLPNGSLGWVSRRWVVLENAAPAIATSESYTLEAIDVGTGLAVLVTGRDFALLYDGGSNDDLAQGDDNRLINYLKEAHPDLRRIDVLILSHPHRDHVELLTDVVERYDIGMVWDSGRTNMICGYRTFLAAVAARPTISYHDAIDQEGDEHQASFPDQTCRGRPMPAAVVRVAHPSRIVTGSPVNIGTGATMTVLQADGSNLPDYNANSLVVRLQLGTRSVLLMGDAEAGGREDPDNTPNPRSIEGRLLACCTASLKSDIMVVGHHGSSTSSRATFIAAVGASDFIVSAGPTRYASVTLPDGVVMTELAARGRVWRTDRDDAGCALAVSKVGRDADGEAGGCDNVRFGITDSSIVGSYYMPAAN